MDSGITYLNPTTLPDGTASSHGAVTPLRCRLIEIGSQQGVDADGAIVGPTDLRAQTAQALANVDRLLQEGGGGLENLYQVRFYLKSDGDIEAALLAWQDFWGERAHDPLITTVYVAGFTLPGCLVEVEARAAVPCDGMNASARHMWAEYLTAYPRRSAELLKSDVEAWAFGIGPEMADELLQLVMQGYKRATATSLEAMLVEREAMPQVGRHSIILDGSAAAQCIIRTDRIWVAPMEDVTDEFARREGEGDRSRQDWLDGHRRAYALEHGTLGPPMPD
ncbi:MAG: ASCH domain-containing protein, partial [Spirochaetota bacterium]